MIEQKIKIVLADDHHVIRQGLKALLETESDLQVVAEASDGIEAIRSVTQFKPDLLILDLMMPVLNGLEVLRQLQKASARTRIIILSMHANEAYVLEAMKSGASGYVLKQATSANLLQAVRDVVAGRRYLSPPLSERAIQAYVQRSSDLPITNGHNLSLREVEVLNLIAEGKTNGEIAGDLKISPRTVEHHRASIMHKVKARNKAELIRYALSLREDMNL
ncbi:MAG: response regulator [Verrucomicrobiales bacterium]